MPRPKEARTSSSAEIRMIDVGEKPVTRRIAKARAKIQLSEETLASIEQKKVPKGDVLAAARLAGIQAAKETSRLLPLCHPIPLDGVDLSFELRHRPASIVIQSSTRATWKTGVEMEALVSVAAAALTIYDMCKALERGITIESIQLLEKEGGRSGHWMRDKLKNE